MRRNISTDDLPLHTTGYKIVDAHDHANRLASVHWYGFDDKEFVVGGLDRAPIQTVSAEIRAVRLNSFRLPRANETLEKNPVVPDYAVAASPQFQGKYAMNVMDNVIRALAAAHIMVILANHMSRADWCCDERDGNGLWASADERTQHGSIIYGCSMGLNLNLFWGSAMIICGALMFIAGRRSRRAGA